MFILGPLWVPVERLSLHRSGGRSGGGSAEYVLRLSELPHQLRVSGAGDVWRGQHPVFAVACAISYMLSANYGLYEEQKIVYSKLHPEFIDRYTS